MSECACLRAWLTAAILIPAAGQRNAMLTLVLKERFDPRAPRAFHPPLPLRGLGDAPHRAGWIQDGQGVHMRVSGSGNRDH